jgi:hypothetical protein
MTPGTDPSTLPRVLGTYRVMYDSGNVVASAPSSPIAIALGAQIVPGNPSWWSHPAAGERDLEQ